MSWSQLAQQKVARGVDPVEEALPANVQGDGADIEVASAYLYLSVRTSKVTGREGWEELPPRSGERTTSAVSDRRRESAEIKQVDFDVETDQSRR